MYNLYRVSNLAVCLQQINKLYLLQLSRSDKLDQANKTIQTSLGKSSVTFGFFHHDSKKCLLKRSKKNRLEMWTNAQRDGRPAEYRWRPLFNAAVWLTSTTRVPCSNAAKTRNPLKCARELQTRQQISAVSRPKFTILQGRVEEVSVFEKFFPIVDTCLSCEDTG